MSDLFSLPLGCHLRAAQADDRPMIHKMLRNLERELSPMVENSAWVGWAIAFGVIALAGGYGAIVPGLRSALRLLAAPTLIVGVGVTAAVYYTLQTDWKRYWVIELEGKLIACAKLNRQSDYSVLYDVYVNPVWRGRGLGSYLVQHLAQVATKPLYLAALPARLPFYKRLGFVTVPPNRLPLMLQYDLGLPTRPGIVPLIHL
uniref:N-acetyltransferase n=1 Tax=Oscillatoriales cyanobacterium SpSt-418 TaxID=2282169 RepID=A0A7C3PHQ5_9CYAN